MRPTKRKENATHGQQKNPQQKKTQRWHKYWNQKLRTLNNCEKYVQECSGKGRQHVMGNFSTGIQTMGIKKTRKY